MGDLGAQLSQLTPEQRQAIMMKAQHEANQQVMEVMVKQMVAACFDKCAGTSVRVHMSCMCGGCYERLPVVAVDPPSLCLASSYRRISLCRGLFLYNIFIIFCIY